jgi:CheY-like chemotaxis protein
MWCCRSWSRTSSWRCLGIGLSLVKSLVDLHGGAVAAWSEGVGLGSRFTVRLKLDTVKCGSIASPSDNRATRGSNSLQVMVVDDNEDAARALAMLLEAMGHTVMMETDPLRALGMSSVVKPDVFILDIGMPGMDGYELARRLRAQPAMRPFRMVAVTGYGRAQDMEAAIDAGFDHHLVKPVNMEDLSCWLDSLQSA